MNDPQSADRVFPLADDQSVERGAAFIAEGNFDGVISVGGGSVIDTAKAMALQSINRDIARIYDSAVAEVGAPDLSAFAAAGAPAPAAGVPSSDIRHELVRVVPGEYRGRVYAELRLLDLRQAGGGGS